MFSTMKFLFISIALGLCLIEVLCPSKVEFEDEVEDEDVMERRKHGEKPQIPV